MAKTQLYIELEQREYVCECHLALTKLSPQRGKRLRDVVVVALEACLWSNSVLLCLG